MRTKMKEIKGTTFHYFRFFTLIYISSKTSRFPAYIRGFSVSNIYFIWTFKKTNQILLKRVCFLDISLTNDVCYTTLVSVQHLWVLTAVVLYHIASIVWEHSPDTPPINNMDQLQNRCYMCIQWTRVPYAVVITWHSNLPIPQFSRQCNYFTSVWSMFVYNNIYNNDVNTHYLFIMYVRFFRGSVFISDVVFHRCDA